MEQFQGLQTRTRKFALRIVKLFRALPKTDDARILGKQLLRSGTSIGANYGAGCRARSRAEFVAKLGIVQEEADETAFWLELMRDAGIFPGAKLGEVVKEAKEFVAILLRPSERQKILLHQFDFLLLASLHDELVRSSRDGVLHYFEFIFHQIQSIDALLESL